MPLIQTLLPVVVIFNAVHNDAGIQQGEFGTGETEGSLYVRVGVEAKLFICVCSTFTAPCHLCFPAPSSGEMIHAYADGSGGRLGRR